MPRGRPFPEPFRQSLSLDVLHHQKVDALVGIELVESANVRMIQAGNGACLASQELKAALEDLNYRNLDDVDLFKGENTTTEFLARTIFERLVWAIRAGRLGEGAKELAAVSVTLHESHVAWASYEGEV